MPDSNEKELLTPRQVDMLRLAAQGLTNQAIALALNRSEKNIEAHLGRIYRKLNAANRVQAVSIAEERKLKGLKKMRNKATLTFFVGVVVLGIIVGMVILQIEEIKAGKSISSPQVTTSSSAISDQQGSYILLLNGQMIAMSDAIFKGMVVSFSATRWNQDSGEAWESTSNSDEIPLQLHYLKVEVLQSIVDDIGLSREINVAVLNPAPVGDDEIDIYSLKEGDEAIFFIVQTEMVWRSGMKPIYRLTNAPWVSYYLLGEDNLYHSELLPQSVSFEEVVADVATKREPLFQP